MTQASAADRKSIRVAEKDAKAAEAARLDVIRGVMASRAGRAWMCDLLIRCHIFHNPFTGDPGTTAFACGEMNIGQFLLADVMSAAPDNYLLMMRERNEYESAAAERQRATAPDADGDDLFTDPSRYIANDQPAGGREHGLTS